MPHKQADRTEPDDNDDSDGDQEPYHQHNVHIVDDDDDKAARDRRMADLQMADLGRDRADWLSSSGTEKEKHKVNLEAIEASRLSNRPGTEEYARAKQNVHRLSAWKNAYDELKDDGADDHKTDIASGQAHRAARLAGNLGARPSGQGLQGEFGRLKGTGAGTTRFSSPSFGAQNAATKFQKLAVERAATTQKTGGTFRAPKTTKVSKKAPTSVRRRVEPTVHASGPSNNNMARPYTHRLEAQPLPPLTDHDDWMTLARRHLGLKMDTSTPMPTGTVAEPAPDTNLRSPGPSRQSKRSLIVKDSGKKTSAQASSPRTIPVVRLPTTSATKLDTKENVVHGHTSSGKNHADTTSIVGNNISLPQQMSGSSTGRLDTGLGAVRMPESRDDAFHMLEGAQIGLASLMSLSPQDPDLAVWQPAVQYFESVKGICQSYIDDLDLALAEHHAGSALAATAIEAREGDLLGLDETMAPEREDVVILDENRWQNALQEEMGDLDNSQHRIDGYHPHEEAQPMSLSIFGRQNYPGRCFRPAPPSVVDRSPERVCAASSPQRKTVTFASSEKNSETCEDPEIVSQAKSDLSSDPFEVLRESQSTKKQRKFLTYTREEIFNIRDKVLKLEEPETTKIKPASKQKLSVKKTPKTSEYTMKVVGSAVRTLDNPPVVSIGIVRPLDQIRASAAIDSSEVAKPAKNLSRNALALDIADVRPPLALVTNREIKRKDDVTMPPKPAISHSIHAPAAVNKQPNSSVLRASDRVYTDALETGVVFVDYNNRRRFTKKKATIAPWLINDAIEHPIPSGDEVIARQYTNTNANPNTANRSASPARSAAPARYSTAVGQGGNVATISASTHFSHVVAASQSRENTAAENIPNQFTSIRSGTAQHSTTPAHDGSLAIRSSPTRARDSMNLNQNQIPPTVTSLAPAPHSNTLARGGAPAARGVPTPASYSMTLAQNVLPAVRSAPALTPDPILLVQDESSVATQEQASTMKQENIASGFGGGRRKRF